MKVLAAITAILLSANVFAQTPLPHGMVYGIKPDTTAMMPASNIESFMGKRTRISTTIKGKVLKVTRPKGGWFTIDAGKGKEIEAHFKNYKINLPRHIQGRIVIIEGVGAKQFIANDRQHYAGDTVIKNKNQRVQAKPKKPLVFEVEGLIVYKKAEGIKRKSERKLIKKAKENLSPLCFNPSVFTCLSTLTSLYINA